MTVHFEYDFEKATSALVYLAAKPDAVPALDKYKAGKLLFLADKYHLVRYGRPILGDFYKALDHGPIPQRTMDALHVLVGDQPPRRVEDTQAAARLADVLEVDHKYRYARFSAKTTPNLEVLSVSELRALEPPPPRGSPITAYTPPVAAPEVKRPFPRPLNRVLS